MIVMTHELVQQFGGEEALRARIDAFKAKLDAHRFTVDVPAPTEDAAIEACAKSEDGYKLEPPPPEEPPPPPPLPGPK